MRHPTTTASAQATLYPLVEFYQENGHVLPAWEKIDARAMPEPYRQLLVHDTDMTSMLEHFHGQTIRLQPLVVMEKKEIMLRQVVLVRQDSRPVEYGAIRIDLGAFPAAARDVIRASVLPLGAILTTFEIEFISAPRFFFCISADAHIAGVLQLSGTTRLYGRVNTLSTPGGAAFAHVVEILPPVDVTQ